MTDPMRRTRSRADRRRRDISPPDGQERRSDDVPSVVVQWDNEPDGIVITLANPLVISNCFAVRDRLARYIDKFTAQQITVDLSAVPYADTAGIGILMEMQARCLQERKRFILRNPSARLREILELFQLGSTLFGPE